MYPTSDEYKNIIRDTSEIYMSGTITTTDGEVHTIDDSNIVSNSVSIQSQALSGTELAFGSSILSELDISLISSASRYIYFGAILELHCDVKVNDTTEFIPMGTWTVAEATRDKKTLKLIAYDNLLKFDKKFTLQQEGSPFELMSSFATDCEAELAEDEQYYESLPNGTEHITISTDSGCATYRDAASVVAQMCGCFVHADRLGKISLQQFSSIPVASISTGQRYSSKIEDFICQYNELEVSGRAGTFIAKDDSIIDGMKMTIESSPAWDYGLTNKLQVRAENLLTYLTSLNYTPSTITIPSDPSIDCGDMISIECGDDIINSIVTSYTWTYHSSMELESSGVNPFLQINNPSDSREIQNLQKDIDAARIMYYPFKNVDKITLNSTLQVIATVVFTTVEETSVIFNGTIQVYTEISDTNKNKSVSLKIPTESGDKTIQVTIPDSVRSFADICIHYVYDRIDQKVEYIDSVSSGGHIITLYYPVDKVDANTTHTFNVLMSINKGSGYINEGGVIGAISGQGLAAISKWNGEIYLEETIGLLNSSSSILNFTDKVIKSIERNTDKSNISDSVNLLTANSTLLSISSYLGTSEYDPNEGLERIVRQQTVTFQFDTNSFVKTDNHTTSMNNNYYHTSEIGNIDSGVLYELPIINTGFAEVTNIEVSK